MTEAELQASEIELAESLGLLVLEIPDSRRLKHGKGFPDLTVLGSSLLHIENKSMTGTLSHDQRVWKWRIQAAGLRWVLWRPADWYSGIIETTFRQIT